VVAATEMAVVITEGLFQAASALEDGGLPCDILGRLYESFAQAALIEAGVRVDLMHLCGFDNPTAVYAPSKPAAKPLIHFSAGKPLTS